MNADPAAPLVSVLLASRNGARFLPEALASIASQTYPAIEAVLVDDGFLRAVGAHGTIRLSSIRYP